MTLSDIFHLPMGTWYNETHIPMDFHSHLFYEIYYFHSGTCSYLIGDSIYSLAPGDLILMNGLTLHRPKVDARSPYCRTINHFDASFVEGMLQPPFSIQALNLFQQHKNVRIRLKDEQKLRIEPLLGRLASLYQQSDEVSYNLYLSCFLELLFVIYEYGSALPQPRTEASSVKEQHVQRVITFLERRYMHDLQMDALARELHLSKYYIIKIFKEVTGFTPFTYLYQHRVNQAKISFLLTPGKSVTDVAYEVGFKHPSHFSRMFKQITGQTPDQHRKAMRRDNAMRGGPVTSK